MKDIKDIVISSSNATLHIIGIGKLKIYMTEAFPHEIPTLSFIMSKDKEGRFIATCIQLIVEGVGNTADSAKENMKQHIIDFLLTLFENTTRDVAWEQLHLLFNDTTTSDLWTAYRDFQLNLAEQGINTSASVALYDKIANLEKQIVDLKTLLAKKEKFEIKIVDYQERVA